MSKQNTTTTGVKRKMSTQEAGTSCKQVKSDEHISRHPKKFFKQKFLESEEEKKMAAQKLQSRSSNEAGRSRRSSSRSGSSAKTANQAFDHYKNQPKATKMVSNMKTDGHVNKTNSLRINNKVSSSDKSWPVLKSTHLQPTEPTKPTDKL